MRFFYDLLPAFQYGVGTDYFSYQNILIMLMNSIPFIKIRNISFMDYEAISTDWMGIQRFYCVNCLLQSLLVFVIVFQLWKNYGYFLFWFFFFFGLLLIYFIPR